MARPTKLTPEVQEKIVKAIRAGNYIETAAAYAGVQKQTLYNWMKLGHECKSGSNKHALFLDAVEKAMAEAEIRDVMNVGKAADDGNWQASAWRLERKYADRWGRKDTHKFVDEFARMSDAELIAAFESTFGDDASAQGVGDPEDNPAAE